MNSGSIFLKASWVALHQGPLELFKRSWRFLRKHKLKGVWVYRSRANAYSYWLKKESDAIREKMNSASIDIDAFSYKPVISVVMPVWNTRADYLERAIASVMEQAYPFWELCIADDASTEPHIDETFKKYMRAEPRVKVVRMPVQGGIVTATNAAINLATGEYVGFLDHDDLLAPHALLEIARLLNKKPKADIIYSDEDRLIENTRIDPFFKPDWSPDLLLSMNYIGHFNVVCRKLLEEVYGLQEGTEGSQDYDLVLRLTERTTNIAHIPDILYHWRMTPGSVSNTAEEREMAFNSGQNAIKGALERRGVDAEVFSAGNGRYRVKYRLQGEPLVSIIIPTKDKANFLKRCIDSIKTKNTYRNYELIVVDNGSSEQETLSYLLEVDKFCKCKVLPYNEPFNYSKINNFAVKHAHGEYILFLNNDVEAITPGWIEEMLSYCQRQEVGAVGVKLIFPDNTIQHGGVIVGMRGVAGHAFYTIPDDASGYMNLAHVARNYSAVTAACMMMRKNVFNEIDGFDEDLDIAFNDVDLCLKIISNGYNIVWTPHAKLYHNESATRGQYQPEHNINYFCKKWQGFLKAGDPFYNPNLSLVNSDFKIKII